ncbi:fasciclin-3-like [Uranotaenia lowii]|uniref:fasciclin-3-like n=1 Tax=Uranotaenia lowii TaxID=190385 RepID=UPI002478F05E|nr:fasciclin-3-like [Uranotaenia lowii]
MRPSSRMATFLLISCLISALVASGSTLDVLTFPNGSTIVAENQRNVHLLCQLPEDQPIDFCVVNVPGVKARFASSERLPIPVEGITFYGDGWSKGSCGVTLAKIKSENDGTFECSVSVQGKLYKGTIDIAVRDQVPPVAPVIEVINAGNEAAGEPFTARCVSRGGWPGATLSWYLDETPVSEEIGAVFSASYNYKTTVQQFFRKTVSTADDSKQLKCRAEHSAYPNGYMEVTLPIGMRQAPSQEIAAVAGSAKLGDTESEFKMGSDLTIDCIDGEGRSAANFLWFLDNQPIYEGLLKSSVGISTEQALQKQLSANDKASTLTCKARHPTGVADTWLKIATLE